MPLGIDATIYYAVELQKGIATYTGELTEAQLKIDSPYNTRTHKGLPPTPDLQPGRSLDRSRRASRARALPVLRRRPRTAAASRCSRTPTRSSNATSRLPGGGQEERRPSSDLQEEVIDSDAAGRARLAGRAQPLAGDPQRRAGGARDERLALSAAAGAPGAVRRDGARARAPRASSGRTSRSRTSRRRWSWRTARATRRGAIGAANTLSFAADGTIAAENTDAPGLIAALGESPTRDARARAGRRRQRAGGRVGAARSGRARGVGLEPHARARRASSRASLGARAVARPEPRRRARQLHLGRACSPRAEELRVAGA